MKHLFFFVFAIISISACSQSNTSGGYENIGNEVFKEKMKDDNTVIVDVRTPEEYSAGHIPGAMLINIHDPDFNEKIKQLDKNKTYLVYCMKGGRSSQAATAMEKEGITNVYNLEKGFSQWNGLTEE